jgi:uncharacterized protein YqjF (DUF2071 family)
MPDDRKRPPSIPDSGIVREDDIDRVSSTRRPSGLAIMRQRWRDLLFLHWAFDPATVRPLIPEELELDLFDGRAYVGLVPFTMTGVRPVGFPSLGPLSRFHETNVRTYVHCGGHDPGVWFFSLDAANRLAVRLARRLFHLPYHDATMFLARDTANGIEGPVGVSILYAGVRRQPAPSPASYLIRAATMGPAGPAIPGTLEYFLAERYLLYSRRDGELYRGRVHHEPYPLQASEVLSLDECLLAAAGLVRPSQPPLAHFAAGVDAEIFALRHLDRFVH